MDCRRVDDWLPAYVEDALPSRRARAVSAHLEACPRCRRERRVLEAALGALDRVGRRTPTIDLWGSFADRLAAEQAAPPRSLLGGPIALRRPFALAGSLALAIGACFLGLLAGGPGSMEPPLPIIRGGGSMASTWRGSAALPGAEGGKAPPALRMLTPVESPEHGSALERPRVVVVDSAARRLATVASKPSLSVNAAEPGLQPERAQLAMMPSAELAKVAEILITAQEDAARAQVAKEMILLAEEMLRGSAPRDEPGEGPS